MKSVIAFYKNLLDAIKIFVQPYSLSPRQEQAFDIANKSAQQVDAPEWAIEAILETTNSNTPAW
ncbi:hypothetical protein [Gloeobacter morelensis]|uniref:Uncharacterized protein n=1 Tax=Gloeobacter morelensis MG652769 TaxID=2781736 RepID=A0ABY3PID4_9CYAN|nr:hypothetical protein [Gloeobacter morelensis]UFP93410.1 hypothetical protein ISF26_16620 [Gloeobacter morelensis MG652769]